MNYQINFSISKGRPRLFIARSITVWLTLMLVFATASVARTLRDQPARNNLPILEPGKPISRELSGGEVHSYQIVLTARQFLHVAVDQRGINLIVTLFDPNGKRIAELEKQIASYGDKAPACDYQYFDNEADLRKFIATNYNSNFNYSTIAVNSTSLAKCLSTFPANSNVYISIIYDVKAGKGMKISNGERICNPFSICCPPNCTPPPRPTKSFALPQSFNPYANF